MHLEDTCPTPTLPDSAVGTPSCRGARPEGQRNIQESTFSISEDLDTERKSCIRVKNPPGGKSSGFLVNQKSADRNIHFHYLPKNNSGIKVKIVKSYPREVLLFLGQEEELDKRKAWERAILTGKP
ncbi:hypothetical protein NQ318_017245, partial [Aromia moschata]